jgi:hypothetical protein
MRSLRTVVPYSQFRLPVVHFVFMWPLITSRYVIVTSLSLFQRTLTHLIEDRYISSLAFSKLWSRDSAVGIATDYGLDDWWVVDRVPVRVRILFSPCCPDQFWGPHSFLSNVYWGFSQRVKRPGHEADHSPPTNAEVKKTWIYTFTPS